jgi:hypothetical protein
MQNNKFTPQEDKYLRDNYLTIPAKTMSKILGRSESGARQRMKLLGLKVPAEVTLKFQEKSRFKKGDTPPNKGVKMTEWMAPEMIERIKATQFKKGNSPHNTKFDGAERICKDGYIEIRVRKGKYVHKHRHEWEKVNGTIPEGLILVCKTENKLNSHPDNWELITRVENMNRNSGPLNLSDSMVATYLAASSRKVDKGLKNEILENHPELIKTKRTHIKLNRKIKEYGKKQNY